MSKLSVFSKPYFLGFDELEAMLDHAAKASGDGYPPYNIERVENGQSSGEMLRITLAVAGFCLGELDISLEENQLTIAGRQKDDLSRDYLHRGIAARQFKKTFVLADGMEVKGADMENGLLSVDLIRPPIERIIRNIEIKEN